MVLPLASAPSASAAAARPAGLPASYDYPPMWHPQRTQATRRRQLERWSAIVQAHCRAQRVWRLHLRDACSAGPTTSSSSSSSSAGGGGIGGGGGGGGGGGPPFRHPGLRKALPLPEAVAVVDWMAGPDGGRRAEWCEPAERAGEERAGGSAWIYWRTPDEWADAILAWVEETGQKNTVLTLYELTEGDGTLSQDFHGMDPEILQKSLRVLVRRGKTQVFGSEDQKGVKFF